MTVVIFIISTVQRINDETRFVLKTENLLKSKIIIAAIMITDVKHEFKCVRNYALKLN